MNNKTAFDHWRSANPDLLEYLCICELPEPILPSKRQEIQSFFLTELQAKYDEICADLKGLEREALRIRPTPLPRVEGLFFDSQTDNLRVRIAAWLRQELSQLSIKFVAYKRLFLNDRLNSIRQFQYIFANVPLPPTVSISIVSSFFETSISDHQISKQYRSLLNYRERLVRKLNKLGKPLWITNFNDFLMHVIDKGVQQAAPDVYYFSPLPEETALSRALFGTDSQYGRAIDNFIGRAATTQFQDFSARVVKFCAALLPREVVGSPERISAGMMIVFRAVMARVFETQKWIYQSESRQFVEDALVLAESPIESLQIPEALVPHLNGAMRVGFLENEHFREASQLITVATFETNPIDGLWFVHRSITQVHTAAIATVVGRPPREDELNRLLPFDDLFALLVGVVIASDIPDLYQFGRIMKLFTPESCFSPILEYAGAHLEAVIAHCKGNGK